MAADVAVMPSRYEPFGVVGLELMALGVPLVASDVIGYVQDGRNGLRFPAGNARGLAEQAGVILGDPELRARLGEQGRATANSPTYQWDNIARQTVDVYRGVSGHVTRDPGDPWLPSRNAFHHVLVRVTRQDEEYERLRIRLADGTESPPKLDDDGAYWHVPFDETDTRVSVAVHDGDTLWSRRTVDVAPGQTRNHLWLGDRVTGRPVDEFPLAGHGSFERERPDPAAVETVAAELLTGPRRTAIAGRAGLVGIEHVNANLYEATRPDRTTFWFAVNAGTAVGHEPAWASHVPGLPVGLAGLSALLPDADAVAGALSGALTDLRFTPSPVEGSSGAGPTAGLSVEDTEREARAVARRMRLPHDLPLRIVVAGDAVALAREHGIPLTEHPRAGYFRLEGGTAVLYLTARDHEAIGQVADTMWHEVFGHFGWRLFSADERSEGLAEVRRLRSLDPYLSAKIDAWYADESADVRDEEFLAALAEGGVPSRLRQAFNAWLTGWFGDVLVRYGVLTEGTLQRARRDHDLEPLYRILRTLITAVRHNRPVHTDHLVTGASDER